MTRSMWRGRKTDNKWLNERRETEPAGHLSLKQEHWVMTMVLSYSEGLYASSPWFWGGPLLLRRCRAISVGKRGEGERKILWPLWMKDLNPLPWPVELALLPSTSVSAGNAALLQPLGFQVCLCILYMQTWRDNVLTPTKFNVQCSTVVRISGAKEREEKWTDDTTWTVQLHAECRLNAD